LIRRIAERVGITKKVNPHIFRHSRATHLATHLTEAQMNEYFGWVQGSNMASTYVHLSGRDVDDALMRMHGMAPVEQDKKGTFSPIKCTRCNQLNPPTGKFCTQCGGILDIEAAMEIEERMKEADSKLSTLLDDEDVQELLMKKMKQLGFA
jgi:ribosomal protein L40E